MAIFLVLASSITIGKGGREGKGIKPPIPNENKRQRRGIKNKRVGVCVMPHGLVDLQDVNTSIVRESQRKKVLDAFTNAVCNGQITPEALSNLFYKQEGYAAGGLGPIAFDLCSNGRLRPEFRRAIMSLLVREGDRVTLRQDACPAESGVSGGQGPAWAVR